MPLTTRFIGTPVRAVRPGAAFFDPGILGPGFFGPPAPAPTPTPAPTPAPAPAPITGPSVNLQALLASIPIAMDGQIITAEHHNSLRAAVIGIADQLGVGLQIPTAAFTFAPTFLQTGAKPNWAIANFVASHSATGDADGWLPIQLPNGQRIQSMTVTGRRTGTTPKPFQVLLLRQSITAPGTELLITVSLESAPDPFQVSAGVLAPTAGSGLTDIAKALVAEDQKIIDTSKYKYFVQALITGIAADTVAEIDAIQITCA